MYNCFLVDALNPHGTWTEKLFPRVPVVGDHFVLAETLCKTGYPTYKVTGVTMAARGTASWESADKPLTIHAIVTYTKVL